MSKVHKSGEDNSPISPAVVLATTIADTTWRMFVPTIGLLLAGRAIDDAFRLKPVGMAVGTIIGAIISGILIKRQLEESSKT